MTPRQELKNRMVRKISQWNYEAWRLEINEPTEDTQRMIDTVKRNGGKRLTLPTFDTTNIYSKGLHEHSLENAINEVATYHASDKANAYYLNASDAAFARFCKEVLTAAANLTASYKRSYEAEQREAMQMYDHEALPGAIKHYLDNENNNGQFAIDLRHFYALGTPQIRAYAETFNRIRTYDPQIFRDPKSLPRSARNLFALLEQHNIYAVHKAACCSSCSCAKLEPIAENLGVIGFVYTHEQDWEGVVKQNALHIRYAGSENFSKPGTWSSEDIGQIIAHEALKIGLSVEWDGNECKCVVLSI